MAPRPYYLHRCLGYFLELDHCCTVDGIDESCELHSLALRFPTCRLPIEGWQLQLELDTTVLCTSRKGSFKGSLIEWSVRLSKQVMPQILLLTWADRRSGACRPCLAHEFKY